MKICLPCSAHHLSPKATKWFLQSIGLYYLVFLCYTWVVMSENLKYFSDLRGGLLRCISVWNIILHLVFYFSININKVLIIHLTMNAAFVKNVVLPYEKFLEKCFLSIVFPLTWSVCSLFWCVYFLDREFIYPKVVEDLVPAWYNHCIHTLPAVIVILHLILVEHKSNLLPMETSLKIQYLLHTLYLTMLIYYRVKHGYWLYDFLEIRTTTMLERLLYFSFYVFVIPTIMVWLGYMLHNKIK